MRKNCPSRHKKSTREGAKSKETAIIMAKGHLLHDVPIINYYQVISKDSCFFYFCPKKVGDYSYNKQR